MSKRIISIILILIVVGVIGLLAYNKATKDRQLNMKAQSAKSSRAAALLVDGYVVKSESLPNTIITTGSLQSNEFTEIRPEMSGRITHIYFKEGAYAKKGDLLVKLFDGDLEAQMEQLKIQLALADTTLERQQKLLEINGISRQTVDVSQNQVASYKAQIDYYEAEISKTEIRAPFSGRLGLRQVSEGAIVSPTTLVTKIYQNNPLKLEFSVPERYSDQTKIGDHVSFTTSAHIRDTFSGTVYAINPGIDPDSRTLTMRAHVKNDKDLLTPGAFASVRIDLKEIDNALMVPTQSLIPTTKDDQLVISKDGKAQFVSVKTGMRTKDKVQILSGIQAGDTVLTTGILQVQPEAELQFLSITDGE